MTEEEQKQHRHGRNAFIPAGVLIGLGIGLLTGYAGPGVLIGLGLGFIATALLPDRQAGAAGLAGRNLILLLIGAFMIVLGVGIVIAPPQVWTFAIPAFLILLGVWFVFRGYKGNS